MRHRGMLAAFPAFGVYVNSPLDINPQRLQQWNLSVQKGFGDWLMSGAGPAAVGRETSVAGLAIRACRPAANSAALWQRRPGSFCRVRSSSPATGAGRSGRSNWGGRGAV